MQKVTFFLVCYIICLNLLLGAIVLKPSHVEQLRNKLGFRKSSHIEHYNRMLAFHRRIDASVPEDTILFIGDSFFQGMCVSAVTENGINFGIGGDTTEGVIKRLPVYKSIQRARAVVLTVGFNDLRLRNNPQILTNYQEILSKIPENIKVLLCSVLPIDESCRSEQYNDRIIVLNNSLAKLCSLKENCKFIDFTDKFRDKKGNLSHRYHDGDGIHLSGEGYRIYNETLKASLMSFVK